MASRVEVHRPPEVKQPNVEVLKKRDAKLVKKAIGRQATSSVKAQSVKESLNKQDIRNGIELDKQQLETVHKALGALATERGITKIPQRYRSRRLARQIDGARKELA